MWARCLAKGHDGRLGWSRIGTSNPSASGYEFDLNAFSFRSREMMSANRKQQIASVSEAKGPSKAPFFCDWLLLSCHPPAFPNDFSFLFFFPPLMRRWDAVQSSASPTVFERASSVEQLCRLTRGCWAKTLPWLCTEALVTLHKVAAPSPLSRRAWRSFFRHFSSFK